MDGFICHFGIDNTAAQAQNHCGKKQGFFAKPLAGWMRLGGDV